MQSIPTRIFRPPALGRLRLATVDDAPVILELITEPMAKNFRIDNASDIEYLIENCILAICQLDVNGTIVGCIAAKDYPLLPSVHPRAWEEYIWMKYKAIELNARNTLFLHLMCWDAVYARDVVDSMLKSMFMHDPHLHHIAMLKPLVQYPLLVAGQMRSEAAFRRLTALERGVRGEMLPGLCIADRVDISPRLRIRRAVEEDNDDIVPILERHSKRLQEMYGEFYISELISRHPESGRMLLVCEHKELAVGVMCLNTQINYAALEESFELSAFAGLRHVEAADKKIKPSKEVESMSSVTGIPGSNDLRQSSEINERRDLKSRITWLFNEDDFKDFQIESRPVAAATTSSAILDVLNLLEDDGEELEYDIVNIDTDLLQANKMSCDTLENGLADSIMKPLDHPTKHRLSSDDRITPKKSKSTMPASPHVYKMPDPEPIRYTGTPNAFLLELFAMHQNYDERYGFDMLEVAFELFPDRDYCVLCLPSKQPSFPLLEHFTLVTPFGSRVKYVNETLYVAHINSVRGNVSVRYGEATDLSCLGDVLEHVPRAGAISELFEAALHSHTLSPYVLLSEKQPIGIVILGPILDDDAAIRTQYDFPLESRRACTDGNILACVLSPALEPQGRWYLRDILRQSHYSTLFWICRLFAKGDLSPEKNLMSLAGHMMPMRPRCCVPNISGNKDLDRIFQDIAMPFALWVLERSLTWLPKVFVNNSIVVVGASRTGLSFVETLLMGPASKYLTFTNITLVSEHGLPSVAECLKAAETCIPREGRYTDHYLKRIPFHFYVDVMTAVMVHIDRTMKCIHLKGGGMKFYDELVLTCGHQFQHPDYLHVSLELAKEVEKGKPCERILMDNPEYQPDRVPAPPEIPDNLMLVNSLFEANVALKKLMRMITDAKDSSNALGPENTVVVYGQCVEAYNCLAALLEIGLCPRTITFVEPFPPEDAAAMRVNCFNNETVDQRVQNSIEQLGIHVLRQCYLAGWRQVDARIDCVQLMAPLHAIRLQCFALFYYGLKAIDINAFKAINESGLVVYDGGLIVGPTFETNDPDIYGAGPCTRYSRRLYAAQLEQIYYRSEDVGEALGKIFLRKMDPFVMGDDNIDEPLFPDFLAGYNSSAFEWQPVMKFESPVVQFSTLPGPLYYMKVHKPGPVIPMAVQLLLPHQGHTLITDKRGNYFYLKLNDLHCVDAVTCLSKKNFAPSLLGQLYGKHEAFFNKLLARYQLGEIEDLYDFFTQPWMSALYQETFSELLRDINEHEVAPVYDMARSQFSMASHMSHSVKITCPSDISDLESKNIGTFRSLIDKFVAKTSSIQIVTIIKPTDIPSECGQSEFLRREAAQYWRAVRGDRVVSSHVASYLQNNSITNPHYARAVPKTWREEGEESNI